jgi:hypothetical protein
LAEEKAKAKLEDCSETLQKEAERIQEYLNRKDTAVVFPVDLELPPETPDTPHNTTTAITTTTTTTNSLPRASSQKQAATASQTASVKGKKRKSQPPSNNGVGKYSFALIYFLPACFRSFVYRSLVSIVSRFETHRQVKNHAFHTFTIAFES